MTDAGVADSGPFDAGTGPDAGVGDAGAADAGVLDAGEIDAGTADAGAFDAGTIDAGTDGGLPARTCALFNAGPLPTTGSRFDTVLSTTGEVFGIAFDGETVWSVIKTADGGTEVYDECQLVYFSAVPPRALHANPDVTTGLLLASGNEVLMLSRDAGVSSLNGPAQLVALARAADGGAQALIWDDSSNSYKQVTAEVPSLTLREQPAVQSCSGLAFFDVDVLESARDESVVVTLSSTGCSVVSGAVTDGIVGSVQAQVIDTAGARTGFRLSPAYASKVGHGSSGVSFAYQIDATKIGTSQPLPDGGVGHYSTLETDGGLQLGDIGGDLVSAIGQGSVFVPYWGLVTFTEPTVFLSTPSQAGRMIAVGSGAFDAGLISHVVVPDGGVYVLWRHADAGVVLTSFH
jgi:hypothetical protein